MSRSVHAEALSPRSRLARVPRPAHVALQRMGLGLSLVLVALALGPHGDTLAQEHASQPTLTGRIDRAIQSVALDLLYDPDAERRWVADNVAPDSYDGVLKGARGTFLTRAGDSADRAALLGALLDASLVHHRYAACETAPTSSAPDAVVTRPTLAADAIADILPSITDPELRTALTHVVDVRAAQRTTSATVATELATRLADAPLSAAAAPVVTAAPGVHVWVQAAMGPGWRDLDPTAADGTPPCAPSMTMDQLPDAWAHHLRIALEIERRTGTEMTTSDALSVVMPTSDVATARIAFGFGETSGFFRPLSWTGGTLAGYTPVLLIDGHATSGSRVELPPSSGTVDALGEILGALGSPSPDGAPAEPYPITGAWLRIDLTDPAGSVTTVRSEVFDRIGRVARVAGDAATAPVQPLDQILGEYPDIDAMWQIGFLLGEVRAPEGASNADVDPATSDGLSGVLDDLLRIYPAAYHDLGGTGTGPMVVLAGVLPSATGDGQPLSRLVIDAAHVPGARPADPVDAATDAAAAVGAEQLLVRLLDLQPIALETATSVFDAAAAQGIGWSWLRPGDAITIDGASPDAIAGMTERLSAGDVLLTPSRVPTVDGVSRTAWWAIDPETGVVRDEHENGRHPELAEETQQDAQAVSWSERFRKLACRVAGVAVVAGSLLFLAGGGKAGTDVVKSVAKAAQAAEENRRKGEQARKIACLGNGGQGGG